MDNREVGTHGERAVARYLEERGWEILERNYRYGRREVDIIARRDAIWAFVEVKTRRQDRFGRGAEAVDRRKRSSIALVAAQFIASRGLGDVDVRFDVASVEGANVEYIEDAFQIG